MINKYQKSPERQSYQFPDSSDFNQDSLGKGHKDIRESIGSSGEAEEDRNTGGGACEEQRCCLT